MNEKLVSMVNSRNGTTVLGHHYIVSAENILTNHYLFCFQHRWNIINSDEIGKLYEAETFYRIEVEKKRHDAILTELLQNIFHFHFLSNRKKEIFLLVEKLIHFDVFQNRFLLEIDESLFKGVYKESNLANENSKRIVKDEIYDLIYFPLVILMEEELKQMGFTFPDDNSFLKIVLSTKSSKPIYIGYTPINLFEQTEPLRFPYVIMPKPNCVIKLPQKGRIRRKGYKEEEFKTYLLNYFRNYFQLYDDRFILIKGSEKPYEPDFTLMTENEGINIFVDIEIDEPYEGINDITKRKATHFCFSDSNRNNAFINRGWIVIRFAEIQVHQNPDGCCLFVADVIANIDAKFKIPSKLLIKKKVISIPQWTKEEAEQMSREKYREKYLEINSFGIIEDNSQLITSETDSGIETEQLVDDELPIVIPARQQFTANSNHDNIRTAININQFTFFIYEGTPRIVKPISIGNGILTAFCYIKNTEVNFSITRITNVVIKKKPYTLEATGPNLGIEKTISIVNTAIEYHKFIRMRYTRSSWTNIIIDEEDGGIVTEFIEAEEGIRTISNVELALNALDQEHLSRFKLNENYVTAYCHRREAQRTFRFDRISEIAILDL